MRYFKRSEVHIPLFFLIISTLWIVYSDKLFLALQKNISAVEITEIQTIKGVCFVFAVAILMHFRIRSVNRRLRKSQEEYKELFYNTPNPMLIVDVDSNNFIEVNKAALDTYKYSAEEFKRITPDDIRANALAGKVMFNGELCATCEHKKKNNERITCIESTKQMSFRNSNATLLSINDITELEKAKSEVIQRESELNQMLNSITDGFFLLSGDMVIKKANELFKKMAGVTSSSVEGQKLTDLFPGAEETISYKHYTEAINSHTAVHFETHSKRLNRWFDVSAYPFDGGLSVFFRDISKEKVDQLERHQNEQNLLALINNTDDLMWSVDCNFRYFMFNEPYRKNYNKIFGEEIYVGKSALNYRQGTLHMEKWKDLYQRALHGEKFTVDMDYVIDDNCHFTTTRFNPIYDVNNRIIGAGCFMQDITERKLHLRKIEQQNDQLRNIAFITSHKVRVPLTNILGLTEVLDQENPLSPSNATIIGHIKTSAKELDRMIINMVQQTVHAND